MTSLDAIREKLKRAQTEFCRAADGIYPENWETHLGREEWSAAEIVAHLMVVERGVIGKADSVTQKEPLPIPLRKRLHLPLWLVEMCVLRRKSPVPLDTSLIGQKEAMLGELRCIRERTFSFLSETEGRNLNAYYWRHPFLGMLSAPEWMQMIASHQIRHTKQMQEIREKLSRK